MINAFRERITSGAVEFAALAATESHCSSARRGGDLGEFGPGQMQPAFEHVRCSRAYTSILSDKSQCLGEFGPGRMQPARARALPAALGLTHKSQAISPNAFERVRRLLLELRLVRQMSRSSGRGQECPTQMRHPCPGLQISGSCATSNDVSCCTVKAMRASLDPSKGTGSLLLC